MEKYKFLPVDNRVPSVGGICRDAWLDYEVFTSGSPARASLSYEARAPLTRSITSRTGLSDKHAETLLDMAFVSLATRMLEKKLANGEDRPDLRMNNADLELMNRLLLVAMTLISNG